MTTHKTWWVPPILLIILLNTFAATDPPAPPSNLECYRPCDETECSLIYCKWDPTPNPELNTSFHLYWMPNNNMDGFISSKSSADGIIHREHFPSDGEFRVWVEATNQQGSVRSPEIVFNAEDIIKPPPPTFSGCSEDPLEICWETVCDKLQRQVGTCEVRYRTEEKQEWCLKKVGLSGSYAVSNPQPNTVYEFQVRCNCSLSLTSNWSQVLRIKSAESTPVGEVDVWRDCDMSSSGSDCFLTWKNLSNSQAQGLILVYEITMSYNNNTVKRMNVSAVESSSLSVYDDTMWRLNSSLKDVSSVSVSAYNALGATTAAHLVLPLKGKEGDDQRIRLKVTEENLTVSWDAPSWFSDKLKQYVVQYKESSPDQAFDWIRVNKTETRVLFPGTFKKYTPYLVSVFAVLNTSEVFQFSAAIGYSVQGTPSKVPVFDVVLLTTTDATVSWEPVPFSEQKGVILYYSVGLQKQNDPMSPVVYNISVTPEHGSQKLKLENLSPDHEYEVWISAVTAAGPGVKVTKTFKTEQSHMFVGILSAVPVIFLIFCVLFLLIACQVKHKVDKFVPRCFKEKIPDPRNSHIFRQAMNQINESFTWTAISTYEPHPKISMLEIVERKPVALDSNGLSITGIKDECLRTDFQDGQRVDVLGCDRTDHRYGKGDYSKMDNSDEERDDCSNSLDEEAYTFDYEKHFMPSASDILGDQ